MKYFKAIMLLLVIVSCKKEVGYPKEIKKYYSLGNLKFSYFVDKDSLLTNMAKYYYPSGQLRAEATMVKDKIHGKAITYFENGNTINLLQFIKMI